MSKHTILFLATNPLDTARLALDQEERAIRAELERSGHRDQFVLETRWAVQPLDLQRELRRLRPTIVHFSGHGGRGALETVGEGRDVGSPSGDNHDEPQEGLLFQGSDSKPQLVSTGVIAETFEAAGSFVRLVVLSACYSEAQSAALVAHVDAAVGTAGSVRDDAAMSFAIGFYGGLGGGETVAVAFRQGCAAIGLHGLANCERPRLELRRGVDADKLYFATDRGVPPASSIRHAKQVVPDANMEPSSVVTMTVARLLELCKMIGLRANAQAHWIQVGPEEAIGHGSRDPRIFYISRRGGEVDLRRYSGPEDLVRRAVAFGGDVSNGQIVARIPIGFFSEEEWRRLIRHNV